MDRATLPASSATATANPPVMPESVPTPVSETEAQRWMLGYLGRLSSTTAQHETSVPLAHTAPFDPAAGPFSAMSAFCAAHADPPLGCDEFAAEAERRRYLPALRRALAGRGRVVLSRLQLPAWTLLLVGPLLDTIMEHIGLEDVIAVIIDTLWGQRCQIQHDQLQEEGWSVHGLPTHAAVDVAPTHSEAPPLLKRRCMEKTDSHEDS